MPKMKSTRGVTKRFKKTKSGKVKAAKAGAGHLLTHKSRKRKRSLTSKSIIPEAQAKKLRRML